MPFLKQLGVLGVALFVAGDATLLSFYIMGLVSLLGVAKS